MHTEWVRTYTEGEPCLAHLRLIADDGSEVVLLQRDELRLIIATTLHEDPSIVKPFRMEDPETGEEVDA